MSLWFLFVNKHVKHYLYDTVIKDDLLPLALRSIFATGTGYFPAQNSGYFPLVFVGISINLAPVCQIILARIFLNEKMQPMDYVKLVIILSGVFIVMLGFFENPAKTKSGSTAHLGWFAWFGLAYVPFGYGTANVAMRGMKKAHFVTVAMYKYFVTFPLLVILFSTGLTFNMAIWKGNYMNWVLILSAVVAQQSNSTLRFLATRYIRANQMAPF